MLSPFDTAAFVPGRGVYVFASDQVWRYGDRGLSPDEGFPRPITAEFPGSFARDLDAAFVHPDGSLQLFRGDQHIAYDIGRGRPQAGYPRPYARDWPGIFPHRIDAALTWDPDTLYVFSGDRYTSFSLRRGEVRRGFPKAIYGNWPELDGGPVRAALSLPGDRRVLITAGGVRSYDRHGNRQEAELELPIVPGIAGSNERGDPGTSRFQSHRFRESQAGTDLEALATGKLRLGRRGDPQYPAPIRSTGLVVSEVQAALIDLGCRLARGADGCYGNETYAAVLAYNHRHKIPAESGYLDGIVGPQTIAHLDRAMRAVDPVSPSPSSQEGAVARWSQERGDGSEVMHLKDEQGEAQLYQDEPTLPATANRRAPFELAALPATVQQAFKNGGAGWRQAVKAAIDARVVDPRRLADLMFFMQHAERMTAGVGKLIEEKERDFVKLRAEWILCFTIVTRILNPSTKPTVFVPARSSTNYEDFVAAPTTGRITLMVHGRNSDGSGHSSAGAFDGFRDNLETFDRMERTVESLGPGDSIYIANWQFTPTELLLTADPAGSKTRSWADLLADKAKQGVKIRVIIAQHPIGSVFMTDLAPLDTVIASLPGARRDNFKYLVSAHSHFLGVHHEKFMVARKGNTKVAFCGGLDLSFNRAPQGRTHPRWGLGFVWHDIVAMLEGKIVHDLEREFVERWNRERPKSTVKPLAGWKALEEVKQAELSVADKSSDLNQHGLQMLRTVAVGPGPADIRRDDIWRGYFRLIGRATRFIYLENQYFHEPKLADAIVRQAESQPELLVIVVVGTGTDDPQTVDPKATGLELVKQRAMVDATQNAFALRLEFFKRLSVAPLTPNRLRVYTLNYSGGILHSKLILVDDDALSVGSANANGRGFFFDTELNVILDDAEATRSFRHRLWAHNLGVASDKVAMWSVPQFFDQWDSVAKANQARQGTPQKMVGEGVIPFKPLDSKDPRFRAGKRGPIHTPLGDIDPAESMF